jgi:DNA-binding MarR family transcriptional regulator
MLMTESVRSGRKANFYITENSFIDNYAKEAGPLGTALYHVLERYMNSETRSTWVGTAKMADILSVSQRTVQRHLKVLEDLKLIRILRNETRTVYVIMPVPPRAKAASAIPLFDAITEEDVMRIGDTGDGWAPPMSRETTPLPPRTTSVSHGATPMTPTATSVSHVSDTSDAPYKEEQKSLNKTKEQDSFNKIGSEVIRSAQTLIRALGLQDTFMSASIAAVEETRKRTRLSMDGVVQDIAIAANQAERRGIEKSEFLENFLADKSARQIVKELGLTATNNFVSVVAASIKAEAGYTRSSIETVAAVITSAAEEDRRTGTTIDRWYFENTKWRSRGRTGKGQQQFERIKRARNEAHAIIDAEMDR